MTIGILTYQFAINYGAQMQCYALYNILKDKGHEVVVINYMPHKINNLRLNDIRQAARQLKESFDWEHLQTACHILTHSPGMRKSFHRFQNRYLQIGPYCSTPQEIVTKYPQLDVMIVGSDQVWAPAHHKTSVYFLNFNPPFEGLKIAYAPCCAVNHVETAYKEQITNSLLHFDHLSVRNKETQDFVKELTGTEVPIVADPTFLWDFKELTSRPVLADGNYILAYILGKEINGGHRNAIEKMRKEYVGLPVYAVSLTASKPHFFSWADKTFWTCNPVEWLNLIRNASYFYTDSFHGVAFALKFHVPFTAYYVEKSRASRFIDLKDRFGLDNIVTHADEIPLSTVTDFNRTDNEINEMKTRSLQYLIQSLKK